MTATFPETITTFLLQLHGHGYFRPAAGPLRARLLAAVGETYQGAAADPALDLEVSIGRQEGEEEVSLGISVNLSGQPQRGELALTELSGDELEELAGYLARLVETTAPSEPAQPGKASVRKKVEGDHHEQAAAAARLKVSPQWLKSVIPCTDYSYDEIDGKKFIREYFWSKDLIERLFKIKCTKTTPEDLQYVAKECCEGDLEWARDLIARLKSPNRGEQAPKDQAQKNQGQAKSGQGERTRSRSRHKRSFRDAGKDARKPQGAPGPKPPTGSG